MWESRACKTSLYINSWPATDFLRGYEGDIIIICLEGSI